MRSPGSIFRGVGFHSSTQPTDLARNESNMKRDKQWTQNIILVRGNEARLPTVGYANNPIPPGKTRITIRLDDEVLDWFRTQVHAFMQREEVTIKV